MTPQDLDDERFSWRAMLDPRGMKDTHRITTSLWLMLIVVVWFGICLQSIFDIPAAIETSATVVLAIVALHWSIVGGKVQSRYIEYEIRRKTNRLDKVGVDISFVINNIRKAIFQLQDRNNPKEDYENDLSLYSEAQIKSKIEVDDAVLDLTRRVNEKIPRPYGQIAFVGAMIIAISKYWP